MILMVMLVSGCSKQDTDKVIETTPTKEVAVAPEEPKPEPARPLGEVLVGVWETVDPAQLNVRDVEKATIDFRASGEFTLISHQEGVTPANGVYTLKGDELTMIQEGFDAGSISTKYRDGILTVTDVANDHSVEFKRVE